jgi:hypothetical protein
MQASSALGLPYSWAPLQSMTAAASRRIPWSAANISANLRGKATEPLFAGVPRFRFRFGHPRVREPSLRCREGKPNRQRSRSARSAGVCVVSDVGRSLGLAPYAVTSDCVHTNIVAASFARTRAEAWERALPRSVDWGRSLNRGDEATLLDAQCRSAEQPRRFSRGLGVLVDSPKRVGASTVLPKAASHLFATEVVRRRKTRSGNPTTSPMGFDSFRRMNPGDRCTDLPNRHHPLSEFLTPSAV